MTRSESLEQLRTSVNASEFASALLAYEEEITNRFKHQDTPPPVRKHLMNFEHIVANKKNQYRKFYIPKKSGGKRTIEAPRKPIKSVQLALAQHLEELYVPHEVAHGFIKKRSTVTNAFPHVGQNILVNVDLKQFFHSIKQSRVQAFLRANQGFTEFSAQSIADACSHRGQLPMGAPTSPILSNLIFRKADDRIQGMAIQHDVKYTRYADDLTFSCDDIDQMKAVLAMTLQIIQEERFELNAKKTRWQAKNTRQVVTGLTVNDKVNTPRKYRRQTRAMSHRLKAEIAKAGPELGTLNAAQFHAATSNISELKPIQFENMLKGRHNYEQGADRAYNSLSNEQED